MTPPRLLSIGDAAIYLGGISEATVRKFVAQGVLVPVRLPSTLAVRTPGETGRRLLFDVHDLDALVDRSKSSSEPNAGLSAAALEGWKRTPVRKKVS